MRRSSSAISTSSRRSSNSRHRVAVHDRTLTELAADLAAQARLRRRAHEPLPRAHRALRRRAERVRHRDGRAGAEAGAGRRRAARARRRGAAHRHPARAQGHLLHGRRQNHVRLEDARQLRRPVRRDRDRALRGRGRRDARQDEHGRVRDGLVERDELLRPGTQPVGSRRSCRAAHRAALPPRSPRASRRPRPEPTPAARFASRRRCPESPASSRRTAACRATG